MGRPDYPAGFPLLRPLLRLLHVGDRAFQTGPAPVGCADPRGRQRGSVCTGVCDRDRLAVGSALHQGFLFYFLPRGVWHLPLDPGGVVLGAGADDAVLFRDAHRDALPHHAAAGGDLADASAVAAGAG